MVPFPHGYDLPVPRVQFPGWSLEATAPDPRSGLTCLVNAGSHAPFLPLLGGPDTQKLRYNLICGHQLPLCHSPSKERPSSQVEEQEVWAVR